MQHQGMVTQNDVVRTQLIVSGFQLALRRTNDEISIHNQQLNVVTGVSDSIMLVPDSSILSKNLPGDNLSYFLNIAHSENHDLKIAVLDVQISESEIGVAKADRLPQLKLYAGSALQRPFIYSIPAVDINYNVWQTGISLHYNLSSTYQTRRKIRSGQIRLEQSRDQEILERQNLDVLVKQLTSNIAKHEMICKHY